jgi:hypothetical protein
MLDLDMCMSTLNESMTRAVWLRKIACDVFVSERGLVFRSEGVWTGVVISLGSTFERSFCIKALAI